MHDYKKVNFVFLCSSPFLILGILGVCTTVIAILLKVKFSSTMKY